MDDDQGPQYALHIALQTLKERCQVLQHRVSVVEKENAVLRERCSKAASNETSLTEIDALKARVLQLTDQKAKLKYNMSLVANENKQLWSRLLNLTQVNKTLGSQLTKINDSLNQHSKKSSPLIRSDTYTQSDAKPKVRNKSDVSLDLEDISLTLISNILKEKNELEAQCSEMAEIQSDNSFGFSYFGDEISDSLIDEFDKHLTDLKMIKETLLMQNEKLQQAAENQSLLEYDKPTDLEENQSTNLDNEEELQLQSLARWGTPENSNTFLQHNSLLSQERKVCPLCYAQFCDSNDDLFVQHVENHFKDDENT